MRSATQPYFNTVEYGCVSDPVHTIPAEFENGMKFLRLGVAFTQCRYEIV